MRIWWKLSGEAGEKTFAEVEDGDIDNASASASAFFDWMVDSGSDLMNMRLKVLEFALWSEHIAYEKVV